jgi:D-xylose reductase
MNYKSIKEMPRVGFGLWKVPQDVCAKTVCKAIEIGYRHLDSASDYGNEKEVGEGIKEAIDQGFCQREDLWVTSKLWNTYHHPDHVRSALERTLEDLQLEYIDLYMIHFPISLEYVPFEERYPPEWFNDPDSPNPKMIPSKVPLSDTWHAMELLKQDGMAKYLGICNYSTALIHDLMSYSQIKPDMLQIESHPQLTQEKLIRLAKSYDIEVTAFSPLGSISYEEIGGAEEKESLLRNEMIQSAAKELGISAAQLILSWAINRGTAIVVKSIDETRMKENLDASKIELDQSILDQISALNINKRYNDPGIFCEEAFNTFFPIYD